MRVTNTPAYCGFYSTDPSFVLIRFRDKSAKLTLANKKKKVRLAVENVTVFESPSINIWQPCKLQEYLFLTPPPPFQHRPLGIITKAHPPRSE